MKIQNPHDKLFKETFANIAVAKDFLNNYLPQNIMNIIDIDTLEPQKDSFINEELKEEFSDLLFRVNINNKDGYLYFLFEHKSYTSKDVSFQLLKYMIEIWEAKMKKEGINELPIVIPMIIYHGQNKWNTKTTLGEMIDGYDELPEDIKEYIPNYKYLLYDISRFKDEEIKGKAQLKIMLTIYRDIFTKYGKDLDESILRSVEFLTELEDKQTGIEYFETLMRYVFSARTDMTEADAHEMIEKIGKTYPEGSEAIMTLAEKFIEKGKEEGIKEGLQKGETKALAKTAIRLLTRKFGPLAEDIRIQIEKLDTVTLEVIIDEIFEYNNLDDIKKYIK